MSPSPQGKEQIVASDVDVAVTTPASVASAEEESNICPHCLRSPKSCLKNFLPKFAIAQPCSCFVSLADRKHLIDDTMSSNGINSDSISSNDSSTEHTPPSRDHSRSNGAIPVAAPRLSRQSSVVLDEECMDNLKKRMSEMRQSTISDLSHKLNCMMDEVMARLSINTMTQAELQLFRNGSPEKVASDDARRRKGQLATKVFLPRNSYLTDLLKINHIKTIYNIFVVMLIVLVTNTAVQDVLEQGETHLGLKTIKAGFGQIDKVLVAWLLMAGSTFATHQGFQLWARKRREIPAANALQRGSIDFLACLTLLVQQAAFIYLPARLCVLERLPPASSLLLMMEQVRMLMKTYAFVRTNATRMLSSKKDKVDGEDKEAAVVGCPEFSKFLYFFFAPTLIYRDEYPRLATIRWRVALWNLLEICMTIFYVSFIFERFILPPFDKYGRDIFEPKLAVMTTFSFMLPGLVMFLFGFYCVLHSTQNLFAELLRFADRQFYKDWWNSTSFDAYYRLWNIPVHDWLYEYVYKDVYHATRGKKLPATLAVFYISAIVHEYILAFAFGFFYPVMFVSFGIMGVLLVFLTKKHSKVDGNVFIWWSLFTGTGLLFSLYSMEYYARAHCPPYQGHMRDLLMPRSWTCRNSTVGYM
ncbi:sterol O-acyltransferase 1 isoform X2 [Trichogramma pretiosum]|uniref:sterol O-acyltransferase 1 isoform X2 n=1 Tax=Trichogramma pretiosum TaxID=7493 RepID=UPI0006C9A31E|nr:sterol O-acyltransferase 1 isoform X2 [Trichogramma pretiosum]